jgi:RecA-family ATPase
VDDRVRRAVEETGVRLLIIDPWATFYGGDENNNDQTEAARQSPQGRALANQ